MVRPASVLLLLAAAVGLCAAAGPVEFNRDVRPILSDKCYHCHGPDAKNKGVPVRLDVEAEAKADRGGKRAIAESDPAASEVVRRITTANKALRMPPSWSGHTLSESEIETLTEWIRQGARWERHWSLIPPARPAEPAVKNAGWVRNSIDRFVLERLEREGLAPSPEATRETLIRRLALDLTGLPPAPSEVDAFLKDTAPDAYDKLVDRLLASPRYGERMAIRWLDAARYADSNGYQFDGEREMWRWRDWVIEAFNRNQPWDRFTLEQIAGDMLPGATLDQKIATGFNRNHRANTEDGIVAEEYAVEYVVDRVETASTVFLGLTLGCARCHNHKYDPISQKDFYQFYAYFNNIPERGRAMKYGNSPPQIPAPTREQQKELERIESQRKAAAAKLEQARAKIDKGRKSWETAYAKTTAEAHYWEPAWGVDLAYSFDSAKEAAGARMTVPTVHGRSGQAGVFDGASVVDLGDLLPYDIEDPFSVSVWVYAEETPHGSVFSKMREGTEGKGFGVHLNQGKVYVNLTSSWVTDAIRLETEEALAGGRWHHISVTYDGSRLGSGVTVYLNGQPARYRFEQDTLYRPYRNAMATFTEPVRIGGGREPDQRFRGLIDEVGVYGRVLAREEVEGLAVSESLQALAAKPGAQRTPAEERVLEWHYLRHAAAPELRAAFERLTDLADERHRLERTFPTVMVMAESPEPKETFVLDRGAYDKPAGKVEPGIPEVLPPLPDGVPNNRLGLAQWLIDPSNPLMARVTVNRFWQMYFGAGLVKSTEDFGAQGEWPTHPELLDWLATEFVRTGWDVKGFQKLIVTSATYRQASAASRELLERDPENRLLARGPRFRLPAEVIRDQALLAAGLLVENQGGPSVRPYQPPGLWTEITMQQGDYEQSKGPDLYRRSLYTFWRRTVAPPMMANFDAANREACVVRASRTNTPLQALNLMNDVTFVEAARFLGQRMLREGGASDAERLQFGFRALTSRLPEPAEERVLEASLAWHRNYFERDPGKAAGYLAQGDSPADPGLEPRELAAWTAVASLMLNLDEAVTKE